MHVPRSIHLVNQRCPIESPTPIHIRSAMIEKLLFTCRYIPVGLLERLPQRINERPPPYYGRNDLETLLSSGDCADWVKIR